MTSAAQWHPKPKADLTPTAPPDSQGRVLRGAAIPAATTKPSGLSGAVLTKSPLIPWSYSRLSKYERCPAQAKWSYTLKRDYVQGVAAARGSAAHSTIENFLSKKTKVLHTAVLPYQHVMEDIRRFNPEVEKEVAIDRNWQAAPWNACWGRGGIDAAYYIRKQRKAELFEWKTGKMYDDHDEQRRIYILFSAVAYPDVEETRIRSYYFDLDKMKELVVRREEMEPIRTDFNARLHIMEGDTVMAPRPGYYCSWCDFSKAKGGPCKF